MRSALLSNMHMETKEIRRSNMVGLLTEYHTLEELAAKVGTSARTLSQIKNRTRNMGPRLARKFDTALGKHPGWIDALHTNTTPQLSMEAQLLLEDFEQLPDGLREHVARKTAELRAFSNAMPLFIRKNLIPPAEPEHYREWERELEGEMSRILKSGGQTPGDPGVSD